MFRFIAVCAVTALFYAAGFVLHARVARLRPAAIAFAGTGLALIPVSGLALYNFVLHQGPLAWLITSLFGTAAYVAAAARLESRILVYLSLTFVASAAWSGVSVLGGALVWYFAALIGAAVLLTLLAMARPRWLPPVYVRPLVVLHPFVVPAVAVAVSCIPMLLDPAEYALIIGLCGVYFALMSAVRNRLRFINLYAARASLTLAAAAEVWHLTGRGSDALLAAAGLLAVQSIAVAHWQARLKTWFGERDDRGEREEEAKAGTDDGRWPQDALLTFGAQLLATLASAFLVISSEPYGYGTGAAGVPVELWMPMLLALATAMGLAWRLQARAEWAPVAALLAAGMEGYFLGAWPLAAMLLLASAFWTLRAILAAGKVRGRMLLAARAAGTLAVPLAIAALMTEGPGRTAAALFGLQVALVCQQLLTAVLQRSKVPTLAPEATLGALAAAGALAIIGLPSLEGGPDNGLTGAAVLIQLLAALAIGWLLAPRPAAEWNATVWETVPLGLSAVAVSVGFLTASQTAGNTALLLLAGYLFATAARLRMRQHRWAYWWLARGTGTVLVLTAYDQLQQDSGAAVVAGEALRPATVLITVLALQLVMPLMAVARRRAPRWILADAGAVLLLQLVACGALSLQKSVEFQHLYAVVVVALCAAASGYVLRAEALAVWFAPVALAALLAAGGGELSHVELLLAIFAGFSTAMVVAEPQRIRKGWYFAGARVLTAGLAVLLSYDITVSPTAVSLTFALVLAAQHAVRWLMRKRLAEIPFQQAAVWMTLAGQALLPLVYIIHRASAGVLGKVDDGGRWVVLLELSLLLVSAVVARRLFTARGALYFALYAALSGVLSLGPFLSLGGSFLASPLLDHTGTAVVLLSGALLVAGAGAARRQQNLSVSGAEHWLWLVTAASFTLCGVLVSPLAGDWLPGSALLVLAAVFFTASHVEERQVLYPPAAAAVLAGAVLLASAGFQGIPGAWGHFLPWLAGAGTGAAVLYSVRLYRREQLQDDPVRCWSMAGAALVGLCLVAVAGIGSDATSWLSALVLAAAVGISCLEAPPKARRITAEIGALAVTAAVQRAALIELDGRYGYGHPLSPGMPSAFWAAQWYVLLASVLGTLRYAAGYRHTGRILVGAAAGLLSLSGLGVIFGGTAGQQLWVLVLLAVLLLVGLGLGDRLFVWWGAAGVGACILWAMRHYTFALLALIAVALIAFAVWRLNRGAIAQRRDTMSDANGVAQDGSRPDEKEAEPTPDRPAPPHQTPRSPDRGPFSRP